MQNDAVPPGRAEAELLLTAAEAEILALAGRVRCGRLLLTRGLEAAEPSQGTGEPGTGHLRQCWRRVLYAYLLRYCRAADH